MTLAEFKAWLEGYRASFVDGVPSAEQWVEVQKRIKDVVPLNFAPYGPRPDDTMTKPLPYIRPYWVDAPTSAPATEWPCGVPVVTC